MKNNSDFTDRHLAIQELVLEYLQKVGYCEVEYLMRDIKTQRKDLQVSDSDIAEALANLEAEKRINLNPPSFPSFVKFVQSPIWGIDFYSIIILVCVSIISVYLIPAVEPFVYLRAALGLVFLLYLPGYSLVELLFSQNQRIDQVEKLGLRIGLSIASLLVIGLILSFTPFGLTLSSVVLAISAFTVVITLLACYRRYSSVFSRKR
jgi:hypothetical protein